MSWPHKCLHMYVNRPTHFCSKFLRLDINSFDVRSKIRSGGTGGCRHRSDRDKLETQVIPDLVPVQLTIIRSNSKSDQNMMCSGLKCTLPTTTKLCTHHDSIKILLRLVEHVLKYSTPNYDRISNSIEISLVGWGPGQINEHPIAESRVLFVGSNNHFDSLVQDCSISRALAMEVLQSCNKPSIYVLSLSLH